MKQEPEGAPRSGADRNRLRSRRRGCQFGSLWYYLPAAVLVKTPLGMLALWAAGAVTVLTARRLRPAAPYLLLLPAVLMAVLLDGSRGFGVR
jgi:hypothetical protein